MPDDRPGPRPSPCSRRRFLQASLAGSLGLGALTDLARAVTPGTAGAPPAPGAPPAAGLTATSRVPLGRSGVTASFVAQGTGTGGWNHSSDQVRLGRKGFERLLRHAVDSGVSFVDAADLYGSHEYVRDALRTTPRDRYALLTKIWTRPAGWVTPSGGARAEVDRFRKELRVDQLDVVLIHSVDSADWPERHARIREELSALKSSGIVRAVGVSCHDFGALRVAADDPWVDVLFARINNRGGAAYSMDGEVEPVSLVLKRARANGKGVVGMKLFGAGRITDSGDIDASLRHVLENDLVDAMTLGMTTPAQIEDALARVNRARASIREKAGSNGR
jgi:aryl-alcohol dehydrogenase-like predicted oxidoreductase